MKKDSKEAVKMEEGKPQIIQINEGEVHAHVDRMVKQTVEEMLNGMLDAEADRLCQARRYERSAGRQDTRAGHYKRKLHVKAGEVELKVPKLRHLPFETAIIERYRRREASVEEALIEMYLAATQAGLYLVPINHHLAGPEIAYRLQCRRGQMRRGIPFGCQDHDLPCGDACQVGGQRIRLIAVGCRVEAMPVEPQRWRRRRAEHLQQARRAQGGLPVLSRQFLPANPRTLAPCPSTAPSRSRSSPWSRRRPSSPSCSTWASRSPPGAECNANRPRSFLSYFAPRETMMRTSSASEPKPTLQSSPINRSQTFASGASNAGMLIRKPPSAAV